MTKEREELFNQNFLELKRLILGDIEYFHGLEKAGGGKIWKKYEKLSGQQLKKLLEIRQLRDKISPFKG